MSARPANIHAVLTGDLIASRKAGSGAVNTALGILADAAHGFGTLHGSGTRFTRSRGDGWQMLVADPRLALPAALLMSASLKSRQAGLRSRIGIGIGAVDSTGSHDLSDASGTAFVLAGEMLDNMPDHVHMTIDGAGTGDGPRALVHMADWIARGWTATQAQAFVTYLAMPRANNTERAGTLSITRQAYEARLRGTGIAVLEDAFLALATHDYEPGP